MSESRVTGALLPFLIVAAVLLSPSGARAASASAPVSVSALALTDAAFANSSFPFLSVSVAVSAMTDGLRWSFFPQVQNSTLWLLARDASGNSTTAINSSTFQATLVAVLNELFPSSNFDSLAVAFDSDFFACEFVKSKADVYSVCTGVAADDTSDARLGAGVGVGAVFYVAAVAASLGVWH